MKKLIAVLVCGILLMSMTATAATWLDGKNAPNPATGKGEGDYQILINGNYTPGTTGETVCVDVAWEAMSFEYRKKASPGEWLPGEHRYNSANAVQEGWSTDKKKITVTNHSNIAMVATLGFTANSGTDLTGTFYSYDAAAQSYQSLTDAAFNLATAVGTLPSEAPKAEAWLGISGAPITENKQLGTVTVNIDFYWQEVSNQDELAAALKNGGRIRLTENVSLTAYDEYNPSLEVSKFTVIDFNGCALECWVYDVKYGGILMQINKGVTCTLMDSTYDGFGANGGLFAVTEGKTVRIKNYGTLNLNAVNLYGYYTIENFGDDATVWAENCEFSCSPTWSYPYCIEGGSTTFSKYVNYYVGDEDNPVALPDNLTVLPGTYYWFDPTDYVDQSKYTVTQDPDDTDQWFVTAK